MLEVSDNIRKGQHAIAGQHIGEYVSDGHIRYRSADAVVLVQQIKDHCFQFSLVVFGKPQPTFQVP